MNELALFAGAGGGILGAKLLGWQTICAVEINTFCARRLTQRQNEGHIPPFPIWDDVCTFNGKPWRGFVDLVSGGFPCQDISCAGKGAGIEGSQSGLWFEMSRIISEVRPRFALVENSPILTARGLDRVCGELSEMGYDAKWGTFFASEVGAAHLRERLFLLAYNHNEGLQKFKPQKTKQQSWVGFDWVPLREDRSTLDPSKAFVCRGFPRMAGRLDRIKAVGNGQVPAVVKLAWERLST